jgi:hypothetical protein
MQWREAFVTNRCAGKILEGRNGFMKSAEYQEHLSLKACISTHHKRIVSFSVSGIRPVSKIICGGPPFAEEPWELDLAGSEGSITQQLQEALLTVLDENKFSILPEIR